MDGSVRRFLTVAVGVGALTAGGISVETAAVSSTRSSSPRTAIAETTADSPRVALRKKLITRYMERKIAANRVAAAKAKVEADSAEQSRFLKDQAAKGCGSELIRKATGALWTCTFADNFNGTALDRSKWIPSETATHGYRSGEECMVDSPHNIRVTGGAVRLTVRKESSSFLCQSPYGDFQTQYTGASISTYGRFSQAGGRYEIRAKFPDVKVPGVHGALWLYPEVTTYGEWPRSGEIDIAEFYSAYPDRAIPYIHYGTRNAADSSVTNNYCLLKRPDEYHTYVAEWTAQRIKITFDGVTCVDHRIDPAAPLTGSAPFDTPFIVVLTQALGVTQNAFDPSRTPLPASTTIDYVRVWS